MLTRLGLRSGRVLSENGRLASVIGNVNNHQMD